MANLTTYELFVGPINIPNIAPAQDDNEAFELFITKYEAELLSSVLGYTLAKDLQDGTNVSGVTDVNIAKIIEGADYTDRLGRANRWPGFETVGYSAAANYIYCKWLQYIASTTTSVGETKANTSNAVSVGNGFKMASAWNDMVDWLYILDDFLTQNVADYPNYKRNIVGNPLFTKDNILGI